jgi:hypothetical protein
MIDTAATEFIQSQIPLCATLGITADAARDLVITERADAPVAR